MGDAAVSQWGSKVGMGRWGEEHSMSQQHGAATLSVQLGSTNWSREWGALQLRLARTDPPSLKGWLPSALAGSEHC